MEPKTEVTVTITLKVTVLVAADHADDIYTLVELAEDKVYQDGFCAFITDAEVL